MLPPMREYILLYILIKTLLHLVVVRIPVDRLLVLVCLRHPLAGFLEHSDALRFAIELL